MRTFERYLYRRTIGDPETYFRDKGITSNEELEKWCEKHDIEKPTSPVFSTPVVEEEPKAKKAAAPPKKTLPPSTDETWHVPAAERPLKKPTAKRRAAPKKKKASK